MDLEIGRLAELVGRRPSSLRAARTGWCCCHEVTAFPWASSPSVCASGDFVPVAAGTSWAAIGAWGGWEGWGGAAAPSCIARRLGEGDEADQLVKASQ